MAALNSRLLWVVLVLKNTTSCFTATCKLRELQWFIVKASHWLLGFSKGLTSRAATTAQYFAAFKFLNCKLVRTKKFCEGQLGIVLV